MEVSWRNYLQANPAQVAQGPQECRHGRVVYAEVVESTCNRRSSVVPSLQSIYSRFALVERCPKRQAGLDNSERLSLHICHIFENDN